MFGSCASVLGCFGGGAPPRNSRVTSFTDVSLFCQINSTVFEQKLKNVELILQKE